MITSIAPSWISQTPETLPLPAHLPSLIPVSTTETFQTQLQRAKGTSHTARTRSDGVSIASCLVAGPAPKILCQSLILLGIVCLRSGYGTQILRFACRDLRKSAGRMVRQEARAAALQSTHSKGIRWFHGELRSGDELSELSCLEAQKPGIFTALMTSQYTYSVSGRGMTMEDLSGWRQTPRRQFNYRMSTLPAVGGMRASSLRGGSVHNPQTLPLDQLKPCLTGT